MKWCASIAISLMTLFPSTEPGLMAEDDIRSDELDAYWAEASRAVKEGDFEGYKATCHEEGVLVSGSRGNSQPLSQALARWKKDFEVTNAGKIKANVEFRYSQRLRDSTTAHETGIFRYSTVDSQRKGLDEYIHFEALLIKKDGQWTILMEYQKSRAELAEWKSLRREP